jgi:hypothetical protein
MGISFTERQEWYGKWIRSDEERRARRLTNRIYQGRKQEFRQRYRLEGTPQLPYCVGRREQARINIWLAEHPRTPENTDPTTGINLPLYAFIKPLEDLISTTLYPLIPFPSHLFRSTTTDPPPAQQRTTAYHPAANGLAEHIVQPDFIHTSHLSLSDLPSLIDY